MSSRNSSILWDKAETDLLVEERRKRNHEYHYVHRGNKGRFWESVSRRIHRRLCRRYSARQCEIKFRNLIKEYKEMCKWRSGARRGGRATYNGAKYFYLFRTEFWKKPVSS